ncbi:MAG TPA: DUF6427 family protein [Bacteroidales bacterium]|nr:DUF6427 family protein [Bacteroidales bacterium]
MFLRQFRRTGPLTIFLIVVILIFLWSGAIIRIKDQFSLYFDIDPMPLYGVIAGLTGTHPVPGIIFTAILVALMALLVVNLNTSLFFINERTFLPALFYVLLSGLFPYYQVLNPAILGSVFLMLAIRKIMQSYRVQGVAYSFFDAGLIISAGCLFYANLAWFALIIFVGIALLRTWNLKELIVSIIGILTPFILTPAIYYVMGKDPLVFLDVFVYNIFGRHAETTFSPLVIAGLAITGFLTLVSVFNLFISIGSKKIQSRKMFYLLLWVLLISVGAYLFVPSVSVEIIWIAGIPVCYFLSHYFIFQRRKVLPEIVFIIFLLIVVLIQGWYLVQ